MGTIADYFFIAGLPDNYKFNFRGHEPTETHDIADLATLHERRRYSERNNSVPHSPNLGLRRGDDSYEIGSSHQADSGVDLALPSEQEIKVAATATNRLGLDRGDKAFRHMSTQSEPAALYSIPKPVELGRNRSSSFLARFDEVLSTLGNDNFSDELLSSLQVKQVVISDDSIIPQLATVELQEERISQYTMNDSPLSKDSPHTTEIPIYLDATTPDGKIITEEESMISKRHSALSALSIVSGNGNPTKVNGFSHRYSGGSMSSNKQRPHLTSRHPSVASKAASLQQLQSVPPRQYNSVIPTPEPLILPPGTHPLKQKFPPELLARWPDDEGEDEIRGGFPDYLPMFAFPNDMNIRLGDDRPKSTWHGFAMTRGDGEKVYGMCVVVWTAMPHSTASEVDLRCEHWRRAHMSGEERELAASLSAKLAYERSRLSEFLARLPDVAKAHNLRQRERIDEQIAQCEERIALLTELLKPVRHGAAAKVEGLTTGGAGMWLPRAFGVLGRDPSFAKVWREYLKFVCASFFQDELLFVPSIADRMERFLPLERYIVNLCGETPIPPRGKVQIELAIRELRLFAYKEPSNEVPGARTVDLYPLFRCLSINNIILLLEAALSESRIIFMTCHLSMLSLASEALISLLFPFVWQGVYIPVLPKRLLATLDAPCPYIIGIENRSDDFDMPEGEDIVICDLDRDLVSFTHNPPSLPTAVRKKLFSLLNICAPLHNKAMVPFGPPSYCLETYPGGHVVTDATVLGRVRSVSPFPELVSKSSIAFGDTEVKSRITSLYNAFLYAKKANPMESNNVLTRQTTSSVRHERPPMVTNPSRVTSSYNTISSSLRRRGATRENDHFDNSSKRYSTIGSFASPRPPSTIHYLSPPSMASLASADTASLYGHSSSFMPQIPADGSNYDAELDALSQPIPARTDNSTLKMREGHQFRRRTVNRRELVVCDISADVILGDYYRCSVCGSTLDTQNVDSRIIMPCLPAALDTDKVRVAFVRSFATLFYSYRKHLESLHRKKHTDDYYAFRKAEFLREAPPENSHYLKMLSETQAFGEFFYTRCLKKAGDPEILLFDEIILAKRNRGKAGFFGSKQATSFLNDRSLSIQRTFQAVHPESRHLSSPMEFSGVPDSLNPKFLTPPRLSRPRMPSK